MRKKQTSAVINMLAKKWDEAKKAGVEDRKNIRGKFGSDRAAILSEKEGECERELEAIFADNFLKLVHMECREASAAGSRAILIPVRQKDENEKGGRGKLGQLRAMETIIFRELAEAGLHPQLLTVKSNGSYGEFGVEKIFESDIAALYDLLAELAGKSYEQTAKLAIVVPLD